MEILKNLNKRQKEAVLHTEGPLLIIAGAGAGKTKTIVHRILYLIEKGVLPEKILAITFTNKAAREMRERVFAALRGGGGARGDTAVSWRGKTSWFPFIGTFHSFGVSVLREHGKRIGVPERFSILDDGDSLAIVKRAVKEADLDPKQFEPRRIKNAISKQKGEGISLEQYTQEFGGDYFPRMVARVWQKYEANLEKEKSLDFDDLLLKTAKLFREHGDIRELYNRAFTHIHIDEYQDTNAIQYELSRLLCGEQKNICVVGDGDQSVYSWRGADFRNILNFEKNYPDAKIVLLEENYRSTKTILAAANDVIKKNIIRKEKNLFTNNKDGDKITLFEAYDEQDEASFVADKITELRDGGVSVNDIAILYRANFQSRVLEEAMIESNISYQVLGVRFFERKEIKDILSYIRAAFNPDGIADLKRALSMPTRGIGKVSFAKMVVGKTDELPAKTKEKIFSFYKILSDIAEESKKKKTSEFVKYVIEKSGIGGALKNGTDEDKEKYENVMELVSVAKKYDTLSPDEGIDALLADASLESDQDSLDEKNKIKNGVKLMTVHASKGLEFSYIFITGLEQDLFPHVNLGSPSLDSDQREEERRLFYVALTRAKEKLFLSYASTRTIFGARQVNTPSEFLNDIDQAYMELSEPVIRKERLKTIYFE